MMDIVERPRGSNADEWNLFLSENRDALPYVAVQIAEAIEALERQVFVPGHRKCAKCGFVQISTVLNVADGTARANERAVDCPNGCGPLWRVTERDAGNEMIDRCEEQLRRALDAEATIESQADEIEALRKLVVKKDLYLQASAECLIEDGEPWRLVVAALHLTPADLKGWRLVPEDQLTALADRIGNIPAHDGGQHDALVAVAMEARAMTRRPR